MSNRASIIHRQSAIGNRQSAIACGFTLIEVMLVVVIVLIAAGITVPRLTGTFKSAQMTEAVRSTVRIARYARSLAILQEELCILRFEDRQLVLLNEGSAEPAAARRLPEDIQITSFETLAGESLRPQEVREVRFYPSGMNDGFKLTLSAGASRRSTISCNPVSGKVTVTEASR